MGTKHIALTIAGSDPTGGAGLQADLKTFSSLNVYGLSVSSVLTAQNTEGVSTVYEIPADFVSEQLDVLLKGSDPDAMKTGMLYSSETVIAVRDKVKEYGLKNLVIDPVMASSTGVPLIKKDVLETMRQELFPFARMITPNIYEASLLTGIHIDNDKDIKEASIKLRDYGPEVVIITGGHLAGRAEDMLYDGKEFVSLETEKLDGEFHGTGCVFSAAVTASLAKGIDPVEAFSIAKDFVTKAMKSSIPLGKGMRILGI